LGIVFPESLTEEMENAMSVVIPESPPIPRIPFATTLISPEAREAVARVLASGWVTTGPEVAEFEREFAAAVDTEHAVAVSSCTAAIELALRSLRLPRGAKVLTSTMTFCGAVHAIVHAGLQPVLVDVNPETVMPDAETVARAMHRAGGVDAMVVLHFAGQPAPVEEMAEAAGLPLARVVEDAAHALHTVVGDRLVGSISAATCFSFYATKNLPIGEGGMVTTPDPEVADFVRKARLHGMSRDAWRRYLPGSAWRYTVDVAGLKANMTDVQAAVGRAQLRHLDEWQSRRTEIAGRYDRGLAGISGLATPARPSVGRHAWHLYVMRFLPTSGIDRDGFIAALAERGVDCSVHFIPIHHQPYFLEMLGRHVVAEFPSADGIFPRIVSLPLHPALSDEEVDRVCESVAEVAAEARSRLGSGWSSPAEPIAPLNGHVRAEVDGRRAVRCLIVGAGLPGRAIASELKPVAEFGLQPIGFLEENGSRLRKVAGLPVLGGIADISNVVGARQIEVVIIALPMLSSSRIRRMAQEAAAAGAIVRYLPAWRGPGERDPRIRDLRNLRAVKEPAGNGHVAVGV
jgi:dTDP-4-amino-4,6-dideoxygalactose transaminase